LTLYLDKVQTVLNDDCFADGVKDSTAKRTVFLLHQWRAFFTPWRCTGVKGQSLTSHHKFWERARIKREEE
jgi:hypothetical protein